MTTPLPEPKSLIQTTSGRVVHIGPHYTADQLHAYAAAVTADKDDRILRLTDALEVLMRWQVKNVKVWHNSAYDYADAALKESKS